uniref:Wsv293a-like protein n=1 Tax=Hemigrapsus takanoi nimavirus TaxID=2133792 RepID=A0A401INW5_9VIRU|nr:MAG: wsv293a-like protein [Hemigrapsus takanoi nimavirus]GBG35328.1 wsv293a-like protein [Hemigrapsus takanoi nimavirus]
MDMDKVVEVHLGKELGGVVDKELAAAREEDNAARASDYILFSILLVSIVFGCLFIFLRISLNPRAVRETLARLKQNGDPAALLSPVPAK